MADKQIDRGWSNHQSILPQLYEQLRLPLMEYWTVQCYSINGFTITCITNSDTYSDANIEQFCEYQYIHRIILTFECEIFLWQNPQANFLGFGHGLWGRLETPAVSTDTRANPTSSSVINDSSAAKLSLSKSLQAALRWLLLASLKTNSTRFGRTHVMHRETNWPQM